MAQVAFQKRTVQIPFIAERIRIPVPLATAKFRYCKAFLDVIAIDRKRHRERVHVLRRVCSHKPSERTPTRATDIFRNCIRIHAIEPEFDIGVKPMFRL